VQGFTGVADSLNTVHINPPQKAKNGKIIPGRFDMVLLKEIANISGVRGSLLSWLLLCLLIHCDQVFVWPKSGGLYTPPHIPLESVRNARNLPGI
jgi:hypothetical protein